ncbi:MAG: carbohydrate ABC transporter permease [Phycisphaerae bacterium]
MIERRPAWLGFSTWALAILLAVVSVGPAAWLLAIALQPPGTDLREIGLAATFDNFAAAWKDGSLAGPLLNSVIVTFARASLNVLIAALAAYPLARMRFASRNLIFVLLLCTMMVPEQVVLVPMFRIVVGMGLYDTLAAVVLPFSVTAFGIFLCRQAFMAIPASLEEAARMDGAGPLRIWWHVMLPLAAPTLATLGLFSIIGAWSDLLWPLIVLQSRDAMTLPVAVNALQGTFATNPRAVYAGAVLSLVPILVIFALLQRFMKPEMFGGAVKG